MNLASYRKRAGYGKRVAWSRNAVAAKERKRIANAQQAPEEEYHPEALFQKPAKHASVRITIGTESISFRVFRCDARRLVMRGKAQAPSTIGRRIALILDAML